MKSFPSKLIAVISSASVVSYEPSLCVLVSMFMGSRFRKKPEVGLRVFMKAGDVASDS